jgi:hypothetical protein
MQVVGDDDAQAEGEIKLLLLPHRGIGGLHRWEKHSPRDENEGKEKPTIA